MDWNEIWRNEVSDSLSAGPSTKSRLRLMLSLVDRYAKPGAKLLDVGCGKGALLSGVAKLARCSKLVGVDVSDLPLEQARQSVPSADFRVLDICASALPERFDVITCMMTLDLVDDEDRAAKHLSDMLEPGGKLLVVVQHLKEHSSELDKHYGVRRHDQASLAALLGRHGLTPVRQFSWGFPLFSTYYKLMEHSASAAGSGKSSGPGRAAMFRLASAALVQVFRVDDWFVWSGRGRVLFGVFERR